MSVAALASAVIGCKKGDQRAEPAAPAAVDDAAPVRDVRPQLVLLREIEVTVVHPETRRELSEDGLEGFLRRALIGSEQFVDDLDQVPEGRRPRHARLESTLTYDVVDAEAGRAIMTAIEARLVWADGKADPAPGENVAMQRDLPPAIGAAELDAAVLAQVDLALQAVAAGLIRKEAVRGGDTEAVAAALADDQPDPELKLWTLGVVRERGLASGYDPAIKLLGSESRDLKEAAIGALMAIGDPRAVKAIADATDTSDRPMVRIAIDAADRLGGEEAQSFLEFLAAGHPDEEIRKQASEALQK